VLFVSCSRLSLPVVQKPKSRFSTVLLRLSLLTMFSKFTALSTLAIALQASALKILQPSGNWWWQTGDQALLSWDCTDHNVAQYTVVVTNPNITLLTGPTPIVAIQDNSQCNINLIPNLNVGKGYVVHLSDIFNATHFYADSDPFEVKPKGSPYPTSSSSTVGSDATASGSGSDSTPTTSRTGSASTMHVAGSAVGLFAIGVSAFLA